MSTNADSTGRADALLAGRQAARLMIAEEAARYIGRASLAGGSPANCSGAFWAEVARIADLNARAAAEYARLEAAGEVA